MGYLEKIVHLCKSLKLLSKWYIWYFFLSFFLKKQQNSVKLLFGHLDNHLLVFCQHPPTLIQFSYLSSITTVLKMNPRGELEDGHMQVCVGRLTGQHF